MSDRLSHRLPAVIAAAAALIGATSSVAVAAGHRRAAEPASSRTVRDAHHLRPARSAPETAVLVLPDGSRQDFGTDIRGCLLAPVPGATVPTAPSHHQLETGPHCVISGG